MSRSPSDPSSPDNRLPPTEDGAVPSSVGEAASPQRSRIGAVWLGGYFDPSVSRALKTVALHEGTTVQALIGKALNDLLERSGHGRPASETVRPRGGAAQRRRD
jgi:hypothetical protein